MVITQLKHNTAQQSTTNNSIEHFILAILTTQKHHNLINTFTDCVILSSQALLIDKHIRKKNQKTSCPAVIIIY